VTTLEDRQWVNVIIKLVKISFRYLDERREIDVQGTMNRLLDEIERRESK
jgi:hypothetical protein